MHLDEKQGQWYLRGRYLRLFAHLLLRVDKLSSMHACRSGEHRYTACTIYSRLQVRRMTAFASPFHCNDRDSPVIRRAAPWAIDPVCSRSIFHDPLVHRPRLFGPCALRSESAQQALLVARLPKRDRSHPQVAARPAQRRCAVPFRPVCLHFFRQIQRHEDLHDGVFVPLLQVFALMSDDVRCILDGVSRVHHLPLGRRRIFVQFLRRGDPVRVYGGFFQILGGACRLQQLTYEMKSEGHISH